MILKVCGKQFLELISLQKLKKKILCIYGPTASGKTQLSDYIAQNVDSVIINADSAQIYKDLPILTCQPLHQRGGFYSLYEIISLNVGFSVSKWLYYVCKEINDAFYKGKLPIVIGGTGLYFSSLIDGFTKVSRISENTKLKVDEICRGGDIYKTLAKYDSLAARAVHPNDNKRIVRALEVFFETGESLYHRKNQVFFPREQFFNIYIKPKRAMLYETIVERVNKMLKDGVIDEVNNVLNLYTEKSIVPKIIGLSSIENYIKQSYSFADMKSEIVQLTCNYAKRQYTWFNNKIKADNVFDFLIN